ncbi:MAG: cytochrome b5-like heme/steroid binding domain-containing protein [archaeon]|nr:cytochrome b5-like heme/steroid binding domain-containing protein [archaeon]
MKKAGLTISGLTISIVIIAVLVVGLIIFLGSSTSSSGNMIQNNPPTGGTLSAQTISLTELSTHNSKGDCWVAYNGEVYDLTEWLPIHPGSSAAIEPYCGTAEEFENAFEGQHGTSKVETLKQMGTYKGELE